MKRFLSMVLGITISIASCSKNKNNITREDIMSFFRTFKAIVLENIVDTQPYFVQIIGKDLYVIVNDSMKISNIREYTMKTNENRKESYKILFVKTQHKRVIPLLYSMDYKSFIIRRGDIFNEIGEKPLMTIDVVEFNVPDSIIEIINKRENYRKTAFSLKICLRFNLTSAKPSLPDEIFGCSRLTKAVKSRAPLGKRRNSDEN